MRMTRVLLCSWILALSGALANVYAAHLVIGTRAEPNSIDPQFSAVGTNQAAAMHMFDTLFTRDADLKLQPALALAATRVDTLTWRLALRPGVRFHDGTSFDAQDVIYSLTRVRHVPFSPASFAGRVAKIARMRAIDPLTVEIETTEPAPQLITDIATVFILPSELGDAVTTAQFNDGSAAVGTGPWRFVRWLRGDRLELVRNPDYWGTAPQFERVTLRFIASDAARVAALLSGSVDLIDGVPPADLDGLRQHDDLVLWQIPTVTFLYLGLDVARDDNPSIKTPRGSSPRNPFKDPRVRHALAAAIDRELLVEKVLSGSGVPANQMMPAGTLGYDPTIPPLTYDPARARRLLAEAGWPNGFAVTLATPNNRYLNDALVAQAVGSMLARIGLKVHIDAMPRNVFLPRATRREFGLFLYGFGSVTGESLIGMRSVLGSVDPKRGSGTLNRGGYANAALDAALQRAGSAETDQELEAQLQEAARLAAADAPLVPLYHQVATWASRARLQFAPRRDERTLAHNVTSLEKNK
jgi:peptide/nickel transport system substrate-binding protein